MSTNGPTSSAAPKVHLKVAENREYAFLLKQTAIVYNRLLEDKFDKLLEGILVQKQQYDNKCNELSEVNEDQALEFAVKAQDELIKLQVIANKELGALHRDYQKKLTKMQQQLEAKWRTERIQTGQVDVKVYPHKASAV